MTDQFDLGGVVVATTLAFKENPSAPAGLAVDYDRFAAHCDFLINNGCRGGRGARRRSGRRSGPGTPRDRRGC